MTIFPFPADDYVTVNVSQNILVATLNGARLVVADGMCEHCRATKFGEFPVKR